MINGGLHADNNLLAQELLVVPVGVPHFRSAMECATSMFHELRELLHHHHKTISVGDEGGFAPRLSLQEALLSICEIIDRTSGDTHNRVVLALDMAATQLFDPITSTYVIQGQQMDSDELIAWYQQLVEIYPIYSLEDPLAEDDWYGWQKITALLGDRIQIVADDLVVTNIERIQRGIDEESMTAVVIKPNQIGTVTETLRAIQLCRENGINTIVSHRSGETNDNFIADLAVGSNAGQIKAGGCCRGERMAKYNRLLAIEDTLLWGSVTG
jgi:enolase